MAASEINAKDLAVLMTHPALGRMLKIIAESADGRLKTREILYAMGGYAHGHRLILMAEDEGYLTRLKVKPEGKGNWPIFHSLTEDGRRIAFLVGSFR